MPVLYGDLAIQQKDRSSIHLASSTRPSTNCSPPSRSCIVHADGLPCAAHECCGPPLTPQQHVQDSLAGATVRQRVDKWLHQRADVAVSLTPAWMPCLLQMTRRDAQLVFAAHALYIYIQLISSRVPKYRAPSAGVAAHTGSTQCSRSGLTLSRLMLWT